MSKRDKNIYIYKYSIQKDQDKLWKVDQNVKETRKKGKWLVTMNTKDIIRERDKKWRQIGNWVTLNHLLKLSL